MRKTVVLFAVVFVVWASFAGAGKIQIGANGGALTQGIGVHAMGPVPVNGGWQVFNWNGATPVAVTENPFTFTLATTGVLTIVDGGVDGDQFEVTDNTVVIGNTSVPVNDGGAGGWNFDNLLTDVRFSKGSFPLAAGAHTVTLRVIAQATGSTAGSAGLRVDAPVPIPATSYWGLGILAALLALGGALVALRMRAH